MKTIPVEHDKCSKHVQWTHGHIFLIMADEKKVSVIHQMETFGGKVFIVLHLVKPKK